MRHSVLSLAVLFAIVGGASAQAVMLAEAPLVDSCTRNHLKLELEGKITSQQAGKATTAIHNARAEHVFLERVRDAKGSTAERVARYYELAKATIENKERTLRPERGLMVAHRVKDQLIAYSLDGPLFSEEMELTEHFDTLVLPGLLPGREFKVGESWTVPNAVVQAICGLDALDAQTPQNLTGTLTEIKDSKAVISMTGNIKGIELGAAVSILVSAKTRIVFDLKEKRIVQVNWEQSDDRKQGPATPNLTADVKITLERTPTTQPDKLSNVALAQMPDGPPPAKMTAIEYRDPKGRYSFHHGREWQFVGERNGLRVLKLMNSRGDWIADATIMPRTGEKLDAKDFAKLMETSPGWEQDAASQVDDKVQHPREYGVVRVTAAGKQEGQPAYRACYYVAKQNGEQAIITFIMPPTQAVNLQNFDQALVESVELK